MHLGISVIHRKKLQNIHTCTPLSHVHKIKWAALYCNEMDSDIENKLKTTTSKHTVSSADPEGGQGVRTPPGKSQVYGLIRE